MFELIGSVVSETEDQGGESWYDFAGAGHFSSLAARHFVAIGLPEAKEYKSNFECWNGTNVWWAPVLFLTSLRPYPQSFFFRSIRSSGLFFAFLRHISTNHTRSVHTFKGLF